MPIDASIYQNLKLPEMASPLDSMIRASSLSQLGMQQKQMAQKMTAEEQEQKHANHLRKASAFGGALESLSGMPEPQRAAAYSKVRDELIGAGVLGQNDAPPEYDPGFYRSSLMRYRQMAGAIENRLKQAQIAKYGAEAEKDRAYAANVGKKAPKGYAYQTDPVTGQTVMVSQIKPLSATDTLKVSEGAAIPGMLNDVEKTVQARGDAFGPVMGRLSSLNPYDEGASTIDAQMRAGAQMFGRYMEGGVLRKEDEEKYRRMFPQISDTPEVAANKLAIVRNQLANKRQLDTEALQAQGYDMAGLTKNMNTSKMPEVLRSKGGGADSSEANAGAGASFTDRDVEMLHIAKKRLAQNPKDEKAQRAVDLARSRGLK